jgi:transposase-like protein
MKRTKYTSEFKEAAVKQVIDKGHPVPDVPQSLGVAGGGVYT